jgi:hypothetical protein
MRMRTFLAATALAAALVLSGCTTLLGSSGVDLTSHHVDPSLCGGVGQVTSLSVHRVAINPERFGFPSGVLARGSAARAVARAMCELPKSPSGVRFCPDDWGPTYHLTFFDGSRVVSIDLATPTGCPNVLKNANSATPVSLAPTGRFWKALGRAVGVAGATEQTFAGTLVDR